MSQWTLVMLDISDGNRVPELSLFSRNAFRNVSWDTGSLFTTGAFKASFSVWFKDTWEQTLASSAHNTPGWFTRQPQRCCSPRCVHNAVINDPVRAPWWLLIACFRGYKPAPSFILLTGVELLLTCFLPNISLSWLPLSSERPHPPLPLPPGPGSLMWAAVRSIRQLLFKDLRTVSELPPDLNRLHQLRRQITSRSFSLFPLNPTTFGNSGKSKQLGSCCWRLSHHLSPSY